MCGASLCKIYSTEHFLKRCIERRIIFLIKSNELEHKIHQAFIKGEFEIDKEHRGREGPRYRVSINLSGSVILIVCEKTKSCFKLITAWKAR